MVIYVYVVSYIHNNYNIVYFVRDVKGKDLIGLFSLG